MVHLKTISRSARRIETPTIDKSALCVPEGQFAIQRVRGGRNRDVEYGRDERRRDGEGADGGTHVACDRQASTNEEHRYSRGNWERDRDRLRQEQQQES